MKINVEDCATDSTISFETLPDKPCQDGSDSERICVIDNLLSF